MTRGIVALDANDTLWRTFPVVYELWNSAARALGAQPASCDLFRTEYIKYRARTEFLAGTYPELAAREGGIGRLIAQARQFGPVTYEPVAGAWETVGSLRARGYVVGILSGYSATTPLPDRLRMQGFDPDHFSFLFAGNDIFSGGVTAKDDPRIFDPFMPLVAAHGPVATYGDDAPITYRPAVARGISYVGFLTGPSTRDEFRRAGVPAHLVLGSVADLPDYLTAVINRAEEVA